MHLVLLIVGHISIELSKVLMREFFVLQFDDDTTMQNTIVEHKVGVIILVIDNDALLASLKAETLTKLKDKLLKMANQGILQIVFIHYFLRLQSEKLKGEWLTNLQGCRVVTLH